MNHKAVEQSDEGLNEVSGMCLSKVFDRKHDIFVSGASLYEATHLTAILSPLYNRSVIISWSLGNFCGFENSHMKTT
jgi:hypothetical protein